MKLILLLILLVVKNIAWWDVGHIMVAQVAQIELQQNHPGVYEIVNRLITAMGEEMSENNNDFITSAIWPDQIKDSSNNFLDSWHFMNKPINPDGIYLRQPELQQHWNAFDCLHRAHTELKQRQDKVTFFKVLYIRYVLHVIGDLHQPLHATSFFNKTFPQGDLGGNRESIRTTNGKEMPLHSYWDSGAQYFLKDYSLPLSDVDKDDFREWGESLMQKYPKEYFGDKVNDINKENWVDESYQLAKEKVYPLTWEQSQLTSQYEKMARKICQERVLLGGYRLANYLVNLYSSFDTQNYSQESKNFLG